MKLLTVMLLATLFSDPALTVKSPAFESNGSIPKKYSCEGANVNPPITISGYPANTKSLALILDDPDAPNGTFDHWVIWNMPPTSMIDEDSAPGIEGKNGKNENKYTGPCPPDGLHHYHFKVFALDKMLDLRASSGKKDLENAMQGHILASGEIIGTYSKNQ